MSTIHPFPIDRSLANVLLREEPEDEEDEDERKDDAEEDENEEDGDEYSVNAVISSSSAQRLFA